MRALAMVRAIEADPQPDGVTKREAPMPFNPGTIVVVASGIAVRYSIEPAGLRFYRIQLVDR